MTHERFDRELRGFLAAREPGPVSPVLRARLRAVTADSARVGPSSLRGGRTWRAAVGLATAAVVVVAAIAVLVRMDGLTVRDPGPAGGPSAIPGAPAIPFVTAPSDLFTPQAIADAERQLAAVYAATGVEARFVVVAQADPDRLTAPEGWPDRFDGDGNPDRDILAVIGVAPDGSPICCLTLMGDLMTQARDAGYWRPAAQPGALDANLAAPIALERDIALDRFVRGIEDLAPGVAALEAQPLSRDDFARAVGLISLVGPLLLLAFVAVRRRAGTASAVGASDEEVGQVEVTPAALASPMTVRAQPDQAPPAVAWDAPRPVAWPTWSDRALLLVSLAAIAGLAIIGIVDLLLPAGTSLRLDPAIDGVGVAHAGLSLVPLGLVGLSLASVIVYLRKGRLRRRIGVVGLVLVIGWTMSVVVQDTLPTTPDTDRGWLASDGGEVTWRDGGGFFEQVTYRLSPGEPFTLATTIYNPGVLPLTILGLDGARTTQPNPYVASIVSLGWVVQPTDDGAITTLSARTEDASASWPVTLAPGEHLAIVIVGRAGPCAEATGAVNALPLTHIDLAYRVLGFERSAEVGLAAILSLPSKNPCTVETPGGTVTYSSPSQ